MRTRTKTTRAFVALFALLAALALGAPPADAAPVSTWRSVSGGGDHTCAIRADGGLYCWGRNGSGQAGNPDLEEPRRVPSRIGIRSDWTAVSAGTHHTCAIRARRLFCFGDDTSGQLGNGPAPASFRLTEVAGGIRDWLSVSAGQHHTCGVRATGRLLCWGNDASGQVGDGGPSENVVAAPRRVAGFSDEWQSVDTGTTHTCAIRRSGRLMCWGDDYSGQVGNGAGIGGTTTPAPVAVAVARWSRVSAGGAHTCAVARDGGLWCWGEDDAGQVGDGDAATGPHETPVRIEPEERWVRVAAGPAHSCALGSTGGVVCWGLNGQGRLGNDNPPTGVDEPDGTDLPSPVTGITVGNGHSCARLATARLWCWGDNRYGQAGTGRVNLSYPRPVRVAPALPPG
jgi:alpha-tubulin suppressor-like RCC1 family protein